MGSLILILVDSHHSQHTTQGAMKSPPSYECLSEDADDENCIAEPTVTLLVLSDTCYEQSSQVSTVLKST